MKKKASGIIKKLIYSSMIAAELSLFTGNLKAQQNNGAYYYYPSKGENYSLAQQAEVVVANSLIHGLVSGIGGARHHQPFLKSFVNGTFAGLIITSGDFMVAKDRNLAWPSKLITSIGASIAYNVSRGRPMLDTFGMEIGPLYLALERKKGNYFFNWYLIPGTLEEIGNQIIKGNRFSLERTMLYGTPVFYEHFNSNIHGERIGFYGSNVLVFDDRILPSEEPHELIHAHQVESRRDFNSLMPGIYERAETFFRKYHIDVSTIPGDLIFRTQEEIFGNQGSFAEWEARIFSGYPRKF